MLFFRHYAKLLDFFYCLAYNINQVSGFVPSYTCRYWIAALPRTDSFGDFFLLFFTAKIFHILFVCLHRFRVIKNRITNNFYVLARNVHIRVIFFELLIYPNRLALVVGNFNVMLEIRLSLLIIFKPRSVFTLTGREGNDGKIVILVRFYYHNGAFFFRTRLFPVS